jgi:hypothetical protein
MFLLKPEYESWFKTNVFQIARLAGSPENRELVSKWNLMSCIKYFA